MEALASRERCDPSKWGDIDSLFSPGKAGATDDIVVEGGRGGSVETLSSPELKLLDSTISILAIDLSLCLLVVTLLSC
jgi:hypothetical protein